MPTETKENPGVGAVNPIWKTIAGLLIAVVIGAGAGWTSDLFNDRQVLKRIDKLEKTIDKKLDRLEERDAFLGRGVSANSRSIAVHTERNTALKAQIEKMEVRFSKQLDRIENKLDSR